MAAKVKCQGRFFQKLIQGFYPSLLSTVPSFAFARYPFAR